MENGMGSETPMEQVILALPLKEKNTFARQVRGKSHSKQKEKCEQKQNHESNNSLWTQGQVHTEPCASNKMLLPGKTFLEKSPSGLTK